jgi:hypothetical protein
MKIRLTLVCAFSLFALACPKAVTTTVMGSDDEMMDQYSAQLEELRTRTDLKCEETCSLKKKVCSISDNVCEIAGKSESRNDFQKRCVTSQEDCARFNENCSTCTK